MEVKLVKPTTQDFDGLNVGDVFKLKDDRDEIGICMKTDLGYATYLDLHTGDVGELYSGEVEVIFLGRLSIQA